MLWCRSFPPNPLPLAKILGVSTLQRGAADPQVGRRRYHLQLQYQTSSMDFRDCVDLTAPQATMCIQEYLEGECM